MNFDQIFNIAGSLITLATITVVLTSDQTAKVIEAAAKALSTNITAAMGR